MRPKLVVGLLPVLLLAVNGRAIAQATPSPAPAASPAAAPAAAPPAIPKNFDPCGGFLELLNKIGNGTACVFVRGEGAVTAQYASAAIPVTANIAINGPSRSVAFARSVSANAFAYPTSTAYIGILPRAQIAITLPSFVQIDSGAPSTPNRSNVLAAGASGMKFEYKQLAYVNLQTFAMGAIDLQYSAPTGSPAFSGSGPSYTVMPIFTQPLPHNYGVTLAFPVNNVRTTGAPQSRGWKWSPQFVPYWESPGGTLVAFLFQHNFQPNVTPVVFSAGQLFGRHFEVSAEYGGFTYSASRNGAFSGLVNATASTNPSLFAVGINYLIGSSDLPAALQQ